MKTLLTLPMIKRVFGVIGMAAVLASPALAGPYVNVENNGGYSGGDYVGSATDFHVGYEGGDGVYSFYAQGGPALISPQGEDSEFELSGKVGGNIQTTENFGIYGELSFVTTDDDPSFGTKIGAKYSF